MVKTRIQFVRYLSIALVSALVFAAGCGTDDDFISSGTTDLFVQSYNPHYLDILWMIDDRSPMGKAAKSGETPLVRDILVREAEKFFRRLDGMTGNYQMGFVDGNPNGGLKPETWAQEDRILRRNKGTVDQRAATFRSLIDHIINLKTAGDLKAFESVYSNLNRSFVPRPGVPLVLVMISDSDDDSTVPGGQDAVNFYKETLLALKGDNADLLKVYSINYLPIAESEKANPPVSKRCATQFNADIDSSATKSDGTPLFEDRFFRLANALNGDTADLCGSWGDTIDLTGLRLKTLSSRFKLSRVPSIQDSITVVATREGQNVELPAWVYESETNEVVFEEIPSQGITLQITFR